MKKMLITRSFGVSLMKYSRVLFFLWVVFSLKSEIHAQYLRDSSGISSPQGEIENKPTGSFRDRLVPGGNFGFNIGNTWFIELSPSLGYLVNERLVSGAGISYVAYGTKVMNVNLKWERYGCMLFSRYRLFDAIFANAELEMQNVEDEWIGKRVWIVNPLAGASYIMPFGNRGGLQVSVLYNLNYNASLSPYPSPLIWRLGFFL
jgi:hypothetical protein